MAMNNTFLYVVTVLIWGSTWLAIEFQLGTVQPEVSVLYRYVIATASLFAWCLAKGLPLRFDVRTHAWFVLLGLLLFSLNYVLTYRAQVHITSAMTAIAFAMMLWMNILLARVFFGIRAGWRVLFGALLGIVGIVVIFAPQIEEFTLANTTLFGIVLALCGALLASFGNMASQKAQLLKLPVVQSNAWGMFYGTVTTLLIALYQGHEFNFDPSPSYVISLIYLAVFGTIVAFWSYLTLLGRIGAHKVGYASVMFPVVALILSILFEGLQVTPSLVAGTALVLVGNVFVLRAPAKPASPATAAAEA